MSRPEHIEAAIDQAYRLESLLRVMSMAVDGEQVSGTTLALSGGGSILDMAADMAGQLVEGLELGFD
jgi:hypothetical protein